MAIYFFDTNSVAKYYATEKGSLWVRRIVEEEANTKVITAITQPELAAALSRMQRLGYFGKTHLHRSFTRFRSDVRRKLFVSHPLDEATLRFASDLALKHPLRGYDAVQVATALLAQQAMFGFPIIFVTSDKQVLAVAKNEGLIIENPENHPDEPEQSQ